MEKIENFASHNILAENIEKLKSLFPTAFSEDKLILRELAALTGDYSLDPEEEYYEMTWAGKSNAKRVTNIPSTGTLRPVKEESKNWDTTENLYIEGDNLEVLKLLQKSYNDRVKMIYIDPPYNTGKEFVYPDNFHDNLKNYLELTGQIDSEGNKITTNTETHGRYHSNWLNMMYPRLKLARNLLTEDGVIFISIDDNEQANLKKLCDEIFGEENFISQLAVINNLKGNNDQFGFAGTHEYALIYSKNKIQCELYGIYLTKKEAKEWETDKYGIYKRGANLKATGINAPKEKRPNLFFPLYIKEDLSFSIDEIPNAYKLYPITDNKEMSWRWSKEKFINEPHNVIITKNNDDYSVYKKQRNEDDLKPTKKPKSSFTQPKYSSGNGSNLMKTIFESKVFDFPKSLDLIIDYITVGSRQNDIILDFFSGSSTTAHAVMALNAEDGGNRKCISVQLPEPTDEKSEAYKAGYKNIADIGKERIRRAGEQIKEEHKDKEGIENLDIGFKVFKLDSSNIIAWDNELEAFEEQLELFEETNAEHIKQDRSSEDVLYEILLKYGLDLSVPIEEKQIDGQLVYNIGAGSMFVCLDDEVDNAVAKHIGEWAKEHEDLEAVVIFKDSAFKDDASKTNVVQTLKQFGINHVKSI